MKKLFFVYVFLTLGTMLEAQNTFGGAGFRERNSKSVNYFMSYSCQKGEMPPDNSSYTALLAKALSSPMGDLEDIFKYVRSETLAQIGQISEEQHTLLNRVNLRDKSKKKIAVLVGNQAYKDTPLQGPSQDVAKMHKALADLGFEVTVFNNLAFNDKEKINNFIQKTATYDIALFYYSGMGMETDSGTWIFPVDAKGNDTGDSWNLQGICQKWTLALPEEAVKICIYDACRNDFSKSR
jgi:Caspase domain